jgi:pimeloyl-ACP methyl ester carboxylesterase
MGGDTVAAAAARRPDLPRAVVMANPAATLRHDDGDADGDRSTAARERIEGWRDREKATLLTEDDGIRAHAEAGRGELASRLADARLRVSPNVAAVFEGGWLDPATTYPDVTAPTLVLKADADAAGRTRARDLAAHLPDGRLVHVPGAGHCVFRDERAASTALLRAFLGTV